MLRRSLPTAKLASTLGGMRRILKNKGTTINYIRQAVDTGVYRTAEEIEKVRIERRDSTDDMIVIMDRFRQNCVRGSFVHDYPEEYLILQQHPPIPDPPRIPKKHMRKMRREPNPTERLVGKYMQRQQNQHQGGDGDTTATMTTEEYYRRLLGVPAPTYQMAMGLKPAALQQAYAKALRHYQLERTEGLTEEEALAQVEALVAQQDARERHESRQRAQKVVNQKDTAVSHLFKEAVAEEEEEARLDFAEDTKYSGWKKEPEKKTTATAQEKLDSIAGIFHYSPRAVEAMMEWSERLQKVPYTEWTVGASTALDHWIARHVLGLSEETWLALLEGLDASLLTRGRDIVLVRETLFPETRDPNFGKDESDDVELEAEDDDRDASEDGDEDAERRKSIQELLASLGTAPSASDDKAGKDLSWLGTDSTSWGASRDTDSNEVDTRVDAFVYQLQDWRRRHHATPYERWAQNEQRDFNSWLREYISFLSSDAEKGTVDLDATRQALLAQPPTSRAESEAFWGNLQDEEKAAVLLHTMIQDGPPPAASVLQKSFWDLSYDTQLERLLNLGAIRPLLDEYTKESDRVRFLKRHADSLMQGVPLEHLVPDPNGPIEASSLGSMSSGVPAGARFRLEVRPYLSVGNVDADEKTRTLYKAWNEHKAGRARYEERLFQTGRLGLRYSDRFLRDDEMGGGDDEE